MDERIEELEATLTGAALADRVEMVVRPVGEDTYRAAAVDGSVTFRRVADAGRYRYDVVETSGRDPLADQATDHLSSHDQERVERYPDRTRNAYPHAFDSIAQFFDAPQRPDLVATHTARHTSDGNLGQHGSLGTVQSRAPFIVAGAGVRSLGTVDRSTRVVDLAPTIATLLGLDPHPDGRGPTGERRTDALLARQDGDPVIEVLDGSVAEQVVVILLDGCNANLLHDVIAAGEAPHVANLVGRGTDFRHGAFASLPTATLANHTTAVTGAHPGHSGVLHNTWLDRCDGSVPDLLGFDQMFWAMQHLSPRVETLFQAVHRSRPGAFSTATFEFCDSGATWSSFGQVRDGIGGDLPDEAVLRHVDHASAESSDTYRFFSRVDHLSLQHTLDAWSGSHGNLTPTLSWCSLALTDEAGHESGPHGDAARAAVRDSDARIGEIVAAVERAGALDTTAFVVVADHGMEQSDPALDQDWGPELAATGISHRDLGGGLIWLD